MCEFPFFSTFSLHPSLSAAPAVTQLLLIADDGDEKLERREPIRASAGSPLLRRHSPPLDRLKPLLDPLFLTVASSCRPLTGGEAVYLDLADTPSVATGVVKA